MDFAADYLAERSAVNAIIGSLLGICLLAAIPLGVFLGVRARRRHRRETLAQAGIEQDLTRDERRAINTLMGCARFWVRRLQTGQASMEYAADEVLKAAEKKPHVVGYAMRLQRVELANGPADQPSNVLTYQLLEVVDEVLGEPSSDQSPGNPEHD